MANRGQTWDAIVHSIADLREYGSKKLPKMYREYYNEGAMDLVTYEYTDMRSEFAELMHRADYETTKPPSTGTRSSLVFL